MIHFVLYNPGVETLCCPCDIASVQVQSAIANVFWPLDEAAQARDRETTFPAALGSGIQHLNFRIDEHGERRGVVEPLVLRDIRIRSFVRRLKHDYTQR